MTSQPSHTLVIHDCKHKHICKSTFHVIMYKNEMKSHMLLFMNAWMMLVLMKCKCQMPCLTLGCYSRRGSWWFVPNPCYKWPVRRGGNLQISFQKFTNPGQKIAFFTAGKIRTRYLPLVCTLLYHYTLHSLISILDFLSPHIILNYV